MKVNVIKFIINYLCSLVSAIKKVYHSNNYMKLIYYNNKYYIIYVFWIEFISLQSLKV